MEQSCKTAAAACITEKKMLIVHKAINIYASVMLINFKACPNAVCKHTQMAGPISYCIKFIRRQGQGLLPGREPILDTNTDKASPV